MDLSALASLGTKYKSLSRFSDRPLRYRRWTLSTPASATAEAGVGVSTFSELGRQVAGIQFQANS